METLVQFPDGSEIQNPDLWNDTESGVEALMDEIANKITFLESLHKCDVEILPISSL
jgi:hypothetical protein